MATAASTGAARKAREREARAQARHVVWLASSYQTLAAHHTSVGGNVVGSLRLEVKQLREALSHMQAEVAGLQQHGHQQVVQEVQVPMPKKQEEVAHIPKVRQQASGQQQLVEAGVLPGSPGACVDELAIACYSGIGDKGGKGGKGRAALIGQCCGLQKSLGCT